MLLINFVLCDLRDSGYSGFTDVVTTAHDANPFTALKGFGKRAVKAMTDILLGMGKTIKQISHWFCTGMIKSTTAAQVDAMRKAGLSEAFIREKWTTHQIGGQYIGPDHTDHAARFRRFAEDPNGRGHQPGRRREHQRPGGHAQRDKRIQPTEGSARSNGPDQQIEYNGSAG